MGSGPECPSGRSSRLGVVFGWVGGVCMKPTGGKVCTEHKSLLLISCCHSATYLLNSLAETWTHRQTHTLIETYLIIHRDCQEEIIEEHCCLGKGVS